MYFIPAILISHPFSIQCIPLTSSAHINLHLFHPSPMQSVICCIVSLSTPDILHQSKILHASVPLDSAPHRNRAITFASMLSFCSLAGVFGLIYHSPPKTLPDAPALSDQPLFPSPPRRHPTPVASWVFNPLESKSSFCLDSLEYDLTQRQSYTISTDPSFPSHKIKKILTTNTFSGRHGFREPMMFATTVNWQSVLQFYSFQATVDSAINLLYAYQILQSCSNTTPFGLRNAAAI